LNFFEHMYNLSNIKNVATSKGITIKELITRAKVTEQGFYKSLENNSMGIKTIAKIADILGVTISELISDSATKSKYEIHKNSLVESPVQIYNLPEDKDQLYKIMYEQQVEITNQQKEITKLTKKYESLKNASEIKKDAKAG
jgi:transcriptional regulator with XRE-family HTH domain